MKFLLYIVYAVIVLCLFSLLPQIHSTAYAAVLINEIFPKPADNVSEWVELYNNSGNPVSLEGWKLENTQGEKKSYTFPAGTSIDANGFKVFFQSQTGLNLNDEGDTVNLFDTGNTQMDSQSYQSILGINNAMGRSSDGGGSWTMCTNQTAEKTNNCPAIPTPTPIPTTLPTTTPAPSNTPTLVPSPTITDTPYGNPFQNTSSQSVLGTTSQRIPTPTPNLAQAKYLADQAKWRWGMGIALAAVAAGGIGFLVVKEIQKRKKD